MRTPDFWERNGVAAWVLQPLSYLYRCGTQRKKSVPTKVSIPVICVGNVVTGGAGKTPVALKVAALLKARGLTPHFLSRGYGGAYQGEPIKLEPNIIYGASEMGDEPLLLAAQAPCWVGQDRVAGAKLAAVYGADCAIMDDGLQNPALHKDVSLLVVDGNYGIGNGRLLPAGPLREPLAEALKRVQALILLGDDRQDLRKDIADKVPVFQGALQLNSAGLNSIQDKRVIAFAGLGRPKKFYDALVAEGVDVVSFHAFADHHPYSEKELLTLRDEAVAKQAVLVTTEKDIVRLTSTQREGIIALPVELTLDDENAFIQWLLEYLSHAHKTA